MIECQPHKMTRTNIDTIAYISITLRYEIFGYKRKHANQKKEE
jgi:hypothetical protein